MQRHDIYSAGYYSQYLWDQRRELSTKAGFDLEQVAHTLATFHIRQSHRIAAVRPQSSTQEETAAAVLHGMLHRGLQPCWPLAFLLPPELRLADWQAGRPAET